MKNLSTFLLLFLLVITNTKSEIRWADKLLNYSSELSTNDGAAKQILGLPNILPSFGYSHAAWMPKPAYGRNLESIKVEFSNPIFAEQVAINENYFSGTVSLITLFDSLDTPLIVYENKFPKLQNFGNVFRTFFPRTQFRVKKLELKVNASIAYKGMQIDAIAISDSQSPIEVQINNATNNSITAIPENLGLGVNSKWAEISPIISQDGKKLFFTRDLHPQNIGEEKYQDIWYSNLGSDSIFASATNIDYPINNSGHNFVISVSPDGNSLIVGNKYNPDGTMSKGISMSNWNGSNWDYPKPINIDDKIIGNKVTYNLASNRKVMLMSCEREDSYGKEDIYVLFWRNDSTWSEPINLGSQINTASSEISPYLAADMTTLYFSTDGKPGYGSNDFFITRRLDDSWTNWSEPQNLGPKFNTTGWDAYFTVPASGDYAYYVSTTNSLGVEDIFRIKMPDTLKPKIVVLVSGRVLNAKDYSPINSKIIYELLSKNQEIGLAQSNPETGEYKIALPAGQIYGFLAEANGFLSVTQNLDLRSINYYQELYRDLYLVPVKKGATLTINNIFFNFGEFQLLPESFSELNRLVTFLKENPEYNIEISGHTDDVGAVYANIELSKNRAKSVSDYFIANGIDARRIKTKGFGKDKPVAPNDTEENRAKNRRVEFKIL